MEKIKEELLNRQSGKISKLQNISHSGRQFPLQDTCCSVPSIKDMPVYDPDAEFTGLALTVPSWMGSINRVRSKMDLREVSDEAKAALAAALTQLQGEILDMLRVIKED